MTTDPTERQQIEQIVIDYLDRELPMTYVDIPADIADAVLAAGFRRVRVDTTPEPPTGLWLTTSIGDDYGGHENLYATKEDAMASYPGVGWEPDGARRWITVDADCCSNRGATLELVKRCPTCGSRSVGDVTPPPQERKPSTGEYDYDTDIRRG